MKLKKMIMIVSISLLFISVVPLVKQIISPKITVDATSPIIVESEVGEQQAVVITLKNAKPYGVVAIEDSTMFLDKGIQLVSKGILFENGGSAVHPSILKGNANWERIRDRIVSFDKREIRPNETFKLVFLTRLLNQAAVVEGVGFTFSYLGREYSAEIKDYQVIILAKTASEDLKEFVTTSMGSKFQGGIKQLKTSTLSYGEAR